MYHLYRAIMAIKPILSPNRWFNWKIAIFSLVTLIFQHEVFRLVGVNFNNYHKSIFKYSEAVKNTYNVSSVSIVKSKQIVFRMENTDRPVLTDGLSYKTLKFNELDDRQIFFHETSGYGLLNLNQACSVESAARHHPKRWVNLYLSASSSPILLPPWFEILSNYPNLRIILINHEAYLRNTPFSDWYRQRKWQLSKYKAAHLSDYLRVATVHRSGGLYMDLDLLVLQEFPDHVFWNSFVYESGNSDLIANSVFHLERGHWAASEIANLIAHDYDPHQYIYHGPEAFTEVVKVVCNDTNRLCENLHVLPHTIINPLGFQKKNWYYCPATNESLASLKNTYAIHHFYLANLILKDTGEILTNSNKLYAVLARNHCPITAAANNLLQ